MYFVEQRIYYLFYFLRVQESHMPLSTLVLPCNIVRFGVFTSIYAISCGCYNTTPPVCMLVLHHCHVQGHHVTLRRC